MALDIGRAEGKAGKADDVVIKQLRRLREGAGLTLDRLHSSGAVLSVVGTSDAAEARDTLVSVLGQLNDPLAADALRVDLGLDLPRLLGRAPTGRELRWLGDRRAGYAEVIGRDVKTLGRWSDRAALELRNLLITDTFDGHVVFAGAVDGNRVLGCSVMQYAREDEKMLVGNDEHFPNPSSEPSMPCLIYAFPRDWRPASVTMMVTFANEPYPEVVWGVIGNGLMELVYGIDRHPLVVKRGMAHFKVLNPKRWMVFGLVWA